MNILLVNPNVTDRITEVMLEEARRSVSPGTRVTAVSAPFGTQYVENRAEAAIAAHAVLDAVATHGAGCDAVIVAAFGDPGVEAVRELFDMPVVGISEAAFHMAWMLGRRYSVVCLTPRLRTWYLECARDVGLDGRLASVRSLPRLDADITEAKDAARDALLEQCRRAVEDDAAEVLIVGGGPLAGLAREIAHRLPVPVIDGVSCAVRLAEALVGLAPSVPSAGSFARPPAKAARGLGPALLARISRVAE
ncbi:MAG: aspartate/glutamate racemase family protein [bacterium]|jgi:Asp/Glu/hydantoin racemase|nr:aspartate/glutamate racemase family protein [Betaproteobacteria bacterium]